MTPGDFLQLADALPEGLMLLDSSGAVLAVNRPARRFLGIDKGIVDNRHLSEFVASSETDLAEALRDWRRSRTPVPAVIKWNHLLDGEQDHWRCQGFLLQPATADAPALLIMRCVQGKTLAGEFLGLNEEVKHQKHLLRKLMVSREALRQEHEKTLVTLSSIGDAVITTDVNGNIEYLNPVAEQLTGWTTSAAAGKPLLSVFRIINEFTRKPVADPVSRCIKEGKIVELANHTILVSHDGTEYVIEDSAAPIRDRLGQLYGVVLVFRDATSERLTRHQLEYLAQHDTLTGLKNRHYFEQQLKHVVDVASRGKHQFALLYIDLDQFKIINDTAGHAAGDALLTEVSRHLSARVRQGDILARLGGDEFGVLVDSVEAESVEAIARDYLETIGVFRFHWDDADYDVSCSIGATLIEVETNSPAEAMRQADIACYIAKREGRNRLHVYSREDQATVPTLGEVSMVTDIRMAIADGEFELHFQPICGLGIECEPTFEALVRMKRNGSVLAPGHFLPVAERHGMMGQIDEWVLNHALRLLIEKCERGASCRLSINLSGSSLGDHRLQQTLNRLLRENNQLAERLILEITETSAVGQLDTASNMMSELRALGVHFALDDFGTGFSSFTYLKHLPVDYVKIDGTFVRDIVDDPVDQAMVRSINQIAHSLDKYTIAEFVENESILEKLKEIGVDMVQGYHIGKPVAELPTREN